MRVSAGSWTVALLLLAGCAGAPVAGGSRGDNGVAPPAPVTEKVIEEIPGPRPGWIDRIPDAAARRLYFVGASGYQAQERDARNDALREAVNAFARYCGVDVRVVDEYLAVSVAKASGVTDPTVTRKIRGTQTTEAFVSRVKGQQWYSRRIERSMGATVLERGWQSWVLVTVPEDEVDRVRQYQAERQAAEAEARAAPVVEPYGRAARLLDTARKVRDGGRPLEALDAYLDALSAYEEAKKHPEFAGARGVLERLGFAVPLPVEAEIRALLAALRFQTDTPVVGVEPGRPLAEPLRVGLTFDGAPVPGVAVEFRGEGVSDTISTGPDGTAPYSPAETGAWPVGNRAIRAVVRDPALARAAERFDVPDPVAFRVEVRPLSDEAAAAWNRDALDSLVDELASSCPDRANPRRLVVLPPEEPAGLTALGTLLGEELEAAWSHREGFRVVAGREVGRSETGDLSGSTLLTCRATYAAERIALACRLVDADTATLVAAAHRGLRLTLPLRRAVGQPAAGGAGVAFTAEFIYEMPGRGRAEIVEGMTLASGSRYRIGFESEQPAHVYAYQIDGAGRVFPFFPNPEFSGVRNPVAPGQKLLLPSREWAFELDDTPGTEELVVVASRVDLPAVDRAFEQLRGGQRLRTRAAPGGELVGRAGAERRTLEISSDRAAFDRAVEILSNPALGTVRRVRFVHR